MRLSDTSDADTCECDMPILRCFRIVVARPKCPKSQMSESEISESEMSDSELNESEMADVELSASE